MSNPTISLPSSTHTRPAERVRSLQKQLPTMGVDAILITHPTDLFYLTGADVSLGTLLVAKENASFFVDSRYIEVCQQTCSLPVVLTKKGGDLNDILAKEHLPQGRKIGFDEQETSYRQYKQYCQEAGDAFDLLPLPSPTRDLRLHKDLDEVAILRAAATLGSRGYDHACSLLKEGVTEKEIATAIEIFWKENGGERPAFDINVSFGANSSMPHHRAGQQKLRAQDIILMDIGVVINKYHSDMTRVVFIGEAAPELAKIYDIVRRAQHAALQLCKPGVPVADLDQAARSLIEKEGYGKEFSHALGHGVGLDIHEFPAVRNTPLEQELLLKPGMVITIEPGIYLPGKGGVRIEDTVVITEEGHENLTQRPTELRVLSL